MTAGRAFADMFASIIRGVAAGAAGTTALNAVTYLDMVLRGRPASSTPEQTVDKVADDVGIQVPGDDDQRQNRTTGAGALTGLLTGAGTGAILGLAHSLGWRPPLPVAATATTITAMLGANLPMTLLGVSDPRRWDLAGWVSDLVPHLAYGLVTTAAFRSMRPRR
jgi:hypothetical protein